MAELRRVGGEMESRRTLAAPRVLLPSEIQLIQALGISDDDYWDFLRINDEHNAKRPKEYDHVPEVSNGPVGPILLNIVIGIALTAISALLAPKPKVPKERQKITKEDVQDNRRFAPQAEFDSLQNLANLGSLIPLVYARQRSLDGAQLGGVRVNSTLLWSYMQTLGRGQQFRGKMLFSHGTIEGRPDFSGYAIGDMLLENYALGKLAVYFKQNSNGGRFTNSDDYLESEMEDPFGAGISNDPFALRYRDVAEQYFSGARTPSTQAVFGTYTAMPNGNRFKVDYELLLKTKSQDGDVDADIRAKQRKIKANFPRFAYMDGPGNEDNKFFAKGQYVYYAIAPDEVQDPDSLFGDITDVQRGVNDARFTIDSNLIVGETYLIGTGYGVCINKTNSPWEVGKQVVATFKLTTDAVIDTRGGTDIDKPNNLTIQRVAVGTISNNRACDRTDLIIRSTVFRKINGFANVNAQPSRNTILKYEDEDGSINIGRMNIYSERLSFFAIQYRLKGESTWTNLMPGNTAFVVSSRSPEAVYNQICIYHPARDAYEYQLAPLSGNAIGRSFGQPGTPLLFYWLNAAGQYDPVFKEPVLSAFSKNGFDVSYTGYAKTFNINENISKEWEIYNANDPLQFYGDADYYPSTTLVGGSTVNLRLGAMWQDYVTYPAEELSNDNGPEHEVVSVNEILKATVPAQYGDLAYAGVRLNSGSEWTNLSQVSAYFKSGIQVRRLAGGFGASNLLPDIAFDLLTNTKYGVGEQVGESQVDASEMAIASKFCEANGFFWDGVISDRSNLREWIFENAGFCLLQFRVKGGRFSLYPDVPFTSSYQLNPNGQITPKALFTDGNMKDLQVSFLSPEERQIFKAIVVYREEEPNGFPQTKTVVVTLESDENGVSRDSSKDPEEAFDISTFCTSKDHAVTFAKYALKVRQLIDHGIKFVTTPQMAMGLEPGEYMQVASSVAHQRSRSGANRLNNASIADDGTVVGMQLEDGGYDIQYWKPGTEGLVETTVQVAKNKVSDYAARGTLFALSLRSNPLTRVYKVESLTYAEDGLVEVAGSVAPLINGRLAILNWGSNDFEVVTDS